MFVSAIAEKKSLFMPASISDPDVSSKKKKILEAKTC